MEWIFAGFGIVFVLITLSSFAMFGFVFYVVARRIQEHGLLRKRDHSLPFDTRSESANWECTHCGRRNPDDQHECDSCGAPANSET